MSRHDADDIYTLVSEFYAHVVQYRNRQDVNFFVEIAKDTAKETGGPVLEVGCGTGVLSILSKLGVRNRAGAIGLARKHRLVS